MGDPLPTPSNVIPLPRARAGRAAPWSRFEKLDGFILDELTPLIGFTGGAAALDEAGIHYVGHLVAKTESDLRAICGIGTRRVARIKQYLAGHGLALGSPNPSWLEHYRSDLSPESNLIRPRAFRRDCSLA